MAEPQTFTARWVFPASGPPLEGGMVTVRGDRIEAVGPRGSRTPDEDLGNVAVIPGLVNAHTHLDLSGARGVIPPTDPDHFTDWLRGVIVYRRSRTPEQTQADIREGLAECLEFGTTLLGDIAAEGQSWEALAAAPLRAVVFREMIGLSAERAKQAFEATVAWHRSTQDTDTCRKGFSPHAPYSASGRLIRCVAEEGSRVAIHIAESPGEVELIRSRTGPFVDFLQSLGVWDPSGLIPNLDHPSRWYSGAGHLLFVHCNYAPREIFRQLVGHYTVVYCPRTHAAFGHPPHPFREFLARGVRVCLGTDSLASNPDLDILAEARFVHERYPDFPGDVLLQMVTLSGAEALGWADEAGSLEPGMSADFVAVPLPDRDAADPHELLFAADAPRGGRRTMFRGTWR
jgi:cytosine/adenosine deaminase-related metal-dependent hydrolase